MRITKGVLPCAKKILLYGPEGIGKSTLAAQFPGAVFIDTEGSTTHMDVARFETPSSWQMLLNEVQYVIDHPDICKTLVIDTADWAERMEIEELCKKKGWDGLEGAGYGRGYQYSAEEFGKLLNKLTEVIHKGINVVMTAHAQLRKVELPEEMGAYDHWEMKTSKKVAPMIREFMDAVFFLNYKTVIINVDGKGQTKGKNKAQGGRRVMYTTHTPFWDAKNRFGLPDEIPLDFNEIAHVFQAPAHNAPAPQPAQESVPASEPVPAPKAEIKAEPKTAKPKPKPAQEQPSAAESTLEEFTGWTAHEKSWYRVGSEVFEFLNGEKIPPEVAKDGVPITEDVYLGMIQNKAMENVKTTAPAGAGYQEPDMRIPKKLRDLMIASKINEWEIKDLVGAKGYFPADMPVADYPPEFIDGWCIGYWDQVKTSIMEIRQKQAYEFK